MAITVKLQDQTVRVGGNFQGALRWVKGFQGRTYDPRTKTWTVPTTYVEFKKRSRFPLDIDGGDHVTKYGNAYTRGEWNTNKAIWKSEEEVADKYFDEHAVNRDWLCNELQKIGVNEQGARYILARHETLDIEKECGRVQFSSPQRRKQVLAAVEKFEKMEYDTYRHEDEELDARKCQILEGTRLY